MGSSRPARLVFLVLGVSAISVLQGTCRQPAAPQPVEIPVVVVENLELRLRLDGVPVEFAVATNDGNQLVLETTDAAREGRIVFANRPPEAGQNLPAEVKAHQSFIEDQEGSGYLGGQELVSPLGTTFYSRGRFLVDGAEIEETVVFGLHPDADRITTMTYRYPAGDDSSERLEEFFGVLAVVGATD